MSVFKEEKYSLVKSEEEYLHKMYKKSLSKGDPHYVIFLFVDYVNKKRSIKKLDFPDIINLINKVIDNTSLNQLYNLIGIYFIDKKEKVLEWSPFDVNDLLITIPRRAFK